MKMMYSRLRSYRHSGLSVDICTPFTAVSPVWISTKVVSTEKFIRTEAVSGKKIKSGITTTKVEGFYEVQ